MNPLQVTQTNPYGERYPFTGYFANLSTTSSFGFPSKGALPQRPFHGIPHREMPLPLQPSFIDLSKSPVYDPPKYQVSLKWKGAYQYYTLDYSYL